MTPNLSLKDPAFVGVAGASGGVTPETSPYSEDFSSYTTQAEANAVWIPQTDDATSRVDISNDYMICYCPAALTGNKNIIKDLGVIVSDSSSWNFTLKVKIYVDIWNATVNYSCSGMFGLWSKDGLARNIRLGDSDDEANGLGMNIMCQSAAQRWSVCVGTDRKDWDGGTNFGIAPYAGVTKYCTIDRTAVDSCSFRLSDNSDYSGGVVITKTDTYGVDSGLTDLRYLGWKNGLLNASSPNFTIHIDDWYLTWG